MSTGRRPFGEARDVTAYVSRHADALRWAAFFHVAAAAPVTVLGAALAGRLQGLGVRAAGPLIGLGGGVLAGAALVVSGSLEWSASRAESSSIVRPLYDGAFAAGGPALTAGLGLLVAGTAVTALYRPLLPRLTALIGVALALVAELGLLTLVAEDAAWLLPAGRFGTLGWLVAAGALLPRQRTRHPETVR